LINGARLQETAARAEAIATADRDQHLSTTDRSAVDNDEAVTLRSVVWVDDLSLSEKA
jgi:hypothetical protein